MVTGAQIRGMADAVRTTARLMARGLAQSPEMSILDVAGDTPAPELMKLARARFEARMARKEARRARYMRRHGQIMQSWPCKGLTGAAPRMMILDDPHAEMPTDAQRATIERWYEDRAPQ
jgi:hypothetical protein